MIISEKGWWNPGGPLEVIARAQGHQDHRGKRDIEDCLGFQVKDDSVIRPLDKAYHEEGGIAVLWGTWRKRGAS